MTSYSFPFHLGRPLWLVYFSKQQLIHQERFSPTGEYKNSQQQGLLLQQQLQVLLFGFSRYLTELHFIRCYRVHRTPNSKIFIKGRTARTVEQVEQSKRQKFWKILNKANSPNTYCSDFGEPYEAISLGSHNIRTGSLGPWIPDSNNYLVTRA